MLGWVGKLLSTEAAYYGQAPSLVAAVKAPHDGIHLVVQLGFNKIIIEGDNNIAIQSSKASF